MSCLPNKYVLTNYIPCSHTPTHLSCSKSPELYATCQSAFMQHTQRGLDFGILVYRESSKLNINFIPQILVILQCFKISMATVTNHSTDICYVDITVIK